MKMSTFQISQQIRMKYLEYLDEQVDQSALTHDERLCCWSCFMQLSKDEVIDRFLSKVFYDRPKPPLVLAMSAASAAKDFDDWIYIIQEKVGNN